MAHRYGLTDQAYARLTPTQREEQRERWLRDLRSRRSAVLASTTHYEGSRSAVRALCDAPGGPKWTW